MTADKLIIHQDLMVPESTIPFSLECCECDAGMGVDSRIEAVKAGWSEIFHDDGPAWNFIGLCPDCRVLPEASRGPRNYPQEDAE